MMMARAFLLLSAVATAAAAPAIVWKAGNSSPTEHSSEAVPASSLLKSAVEGSSHDALAVVFVVNRDKDGSEALSRLASSGSLPQIQSKYESATSIHHHVAGVEGAASAAEHAGGHQVSLHEFDGMLESEHKPAVMVVGVDRHEDMSKLDGAVVKALSHSKVRSVVLTAQRSVEEVKNERALSRRRNKQINRKRKVLTNDKRRRLEDAQEDAEEDAEEEEEVDVSYYVNMTPNIFSGILFTLFFVFVSHLGLTCMGQITHSDVLQSKVPSVGREV